MSCHPRVTEWTTIIHTQLKPEDMVKENFPGLLAL